MSFEAFRFGGTSPGGRTDVPAGEPSDVNLPLVPGERIELEPGRYPDARPAAPPSIEELLPRASRRRGEEDIHFVTKEKLVADWLREAGHTVVSIKRREWEYQKTPDALIVCNAHWVSLEIKTLESSSDTAVAALIRKARRQARIAVIDGFGVGLVRETAEAGLRAAVRKYGLDLTQVVIRLGDGSAVYWVS